MHPMVLICLKNPIKFLNKSAGEFFIKKDGYELALTDELKDYIHLETFKQHFKDIIEYKTLYYYKTRGLKWTIMMKTAKNSLREL